MSLCQNEGLNSKKGEEASLFYLGRFFFCLAMLAAAALFIILPYSFWWLYESGDSGMERAVRDQASGKFAIFGSGISQNFMEYKLELYRNIKPDMVVFGSSRVMQIRGAWFKSSFVNMGGVAGNISALRYAVNEALRIHKPKAVIIGIDFWWFMPQWENNPEKPFAAIHGSYNYGLENLKKLWSWLLEGKISFKEAAAPILGIFGKGFRADRYGIMAQQTDDGFGPDGSWYNTAEITGLKPPFDYQFLDTLTQIQNGIKAFFYAGKDQDGPAQNHLDAFAEIWCKLRSRGIRTFIFIPPMAQKTYDLMKKLEKNYPHLFNLRQALMEKGIEVMDFSNPASMASSDCEFIDGFHGGEIAYARILRHMADHWPALLAYINMEKLDMLINSWHGYAMSHDKRVTSRPEIDFMNFNCPGHFADGSFERIKGIK